MGGRGCVNLPAARGDAGTEENNYQPRVYQRARAGLGVGFFYTLLFLTQITLAEPACNTAALNPWEMEGKGKASCLPMPRRATKPPGKINIPAFRYDKRRWKPQPCCQDMLEPVPGHHLLLSRYRTTLQRSLGARGSWWHGEGHPCHVSALHLWLDAAQPPQREIFVSCFPPSGVSRGAALLHLHLTFAAKRSLTFLIP